MTTPNFEIPSSMTYHWSVCMNTATEIDVWFLPNCVHSLWIKKYHCRLDICMYYSVRFIEKVIALSGTPRKFTTSIFLFFCSLPSGITLNKILKIYLQQWIWINACIYQVYVFRSWLVRSRLTPVMTDNLPVQCLKEKYWIKTKQVTWLKQWVLVERMKRCINIIWSVYHHFYFYHPLLKSSYNSIPLLFIFNQMKKSCLSSMI